MRFLLLAAALVFAAHTAWADDETVVTPGGEIRVRGEARNDHDFNPKKYDHINWLGLRARAHVLAFPNPHLEALVQIQYANLLGANPDAVTDPTFIRFLNGNQRAGAGHLNLHQGYLRLKNLWDQPLHLKIGRQELIYGDQRLVGPLDYAMIPRFFDAVKLEYAFDIPLQVDAFAARMSQGPFAPATTATPKPVAADPDKNLDFFGAYARTWAIRGLLIDGYEFIVRDGFPRKFGTENPRSAAHPAVFYTTGGRVEYIGISDLNVTGEFAYQNGRKYNVPHQAHAWAARGYYKFSKVPLVPGLGAEADFATGDRDPKDGKNTEFDQLFPTNHNKYGFMDLFGWRNIRAYNARVGIQPNRDISFFVDGWSFSLPEPRGVWRNAGPGVVLAKPVAAGKAIESHDAGQELDLTLAWKFYGRASVLAHYGVFVPGDLIKEQPGRHANATFGMVQIESSF